MTLLKMFKFRVYLLRKLCIVFIGALIVYKVHQNTKINFDESTISTTINEKELPPWLTSKHIQDFNEELLKSEAFVNMYNSQSACQIPPFPLVNPEYLHVLRKQLPQHNCKTDRFPLIFKSVLYPHPKLIPLKSANEVQNLYGVTQCCMRKINDFIGELDPGYVNSAEKCLPLSFKIKNDVPLNWEFLVIECEFTFPQHKETRNIDVHSFIRSDEPRSTKTQNHRKFPNVILFGLDGTSRLNFHRNFPEVHQFLVQNLSAVEVKKYHKVGSNTFPNLEPLLTNQKVIYEGNITGYYLGCETSDRTYDNCPFIWKKFKSAGYKTFYGEDFGLPLDVYFWKNGFRKPPTDVFLRPLTFTASSTIGHDGFGHAKPKYICPKCFGPQLAFQVLRNSFNQFLEKSVNDKNSYFAFLFSSSGTHDEATGGRLIVPHLLELLKYLQSEGHLNNTVFILFGDHGTRAGSIRHHFQGYIEERLPLFYMVVPKWFREKHNKQYNNLVENSKNRLVTHFEIYKTLLDLLPGSKFATLQSDMAKPGPGISLFSDIPISRTCETADILKEFCACNLKLSPFATNDTGMVNAALRAVEHINKLLQTKRNCAQLSLNSVFNAEALLNTETNSIDVYRIVFETIPGNANFEALFRPNETTGQFNYDPLSIDLRPDEFQGSIERINIYRDDSWCVDDRRLKPFCYCSNLESSPNW